MLFKVFWLILSSFGLFLLVFLCIITFRSSFLIGNAQFYRHISIVSLLFSLVWAKIVERITNFVNGSKTTTLLQSLLLSIMHKNISIWQVFFASSRQWHSNICNLRVRLRFFSKANWKLLIFGLYYTYIKDVRQLLTKQKVYTNAYAMV